MNRFLIESKTVKRLNNESKRHDNDNTIKIKLTRLINDRHEKKNYDPHEYNSTKTITSSSTITTQLNTIIIIYVKLSPYVKVISILNYKRKIYEVMLE